LFGEKKSKKMKDSEEEDDDDEDADDADAESEEEKPDKVDCKIYCAPITIPLKYIHVLVYLLILITVLTLYQVQRC
jgi:hypothetical protein